MNKLVSICVATYNGEKYIREQLDSLLSQTYQHLEILLQDDCSTDNTFQILTEYAEQYDNIKLFQNKKNLGYTKNFQSLIQKSKGAYIMLCDQDDIWENKKIEILLNNINDNTLIYHNSLLVNAEGNSMEQTLSQKLQNNFISSNTALTFIFDNCISAHAMLFKKELLTFIKNIPESIYFDQYIAATAASLNGVTYIDQNLVQYRQHSTNTLKKKKMKKTVMKKIQEKSQKKLIENTLLIQKLQDFSQIATLQQNEKEILNILLSYYKNFKGSFFQLDMFLFLLKNKNILFQITKKNSNSISLKHALGYKLYKVFPIL